MQNVKSIGRKIAKLKKSIEPVVTEIATLRGEQVLLEVEADILELKSKFEGRFFKVEEFQECEAFVFVHKVINEYDLLVTSIATEYESFEFAVVTKKVLSADRLEKSRGRIVSEIAKETFMFKFHEFNDELLKVETSINTQS